MVNVFYDTGIVYTIDLSSQTVVASAPYGASAPPASNNVFNGVPHNHQASGTFPNDPTISYFFYYDGTINKVYKHNSTSNTTSIHDIGSGTNQLFPGLPTNQAMDRAVISLQMGVCMLNGRIHQLVLSATAIYRRNNRFREVLHLPQR